MLDKLISGGQTGADRAALDVGLALGLSVGGGCPQDRRAEDGGIPDRYPLSETPERNDQTRTGRNIEDSDGTLILNLGTLEGGTALTASHACQIGKPCLIVALETGFEPAAFRPWLVENHSLLTMREKSYALRLVEHPQWPEFSEKASITVLSIPWNMKSNQQRRQEIKAHRLRRNAQKARALDARPVDRPLGTVAVTPARLRATHSYGLSDFVQRGYYQDRPFRCKDCGKAELWTAAQQQWWYEEAQGDVWTVAVRCRACRQQERARKAEARRIHREGLAMKQVQRWLISHPHEQNDDLRPRL